MITQQTVGGAMFVITIFKEVQLQLAALCTKWNPDHEKKKEKQKQSFAIG